MGGPVIVGPKLLDGLIAYVEMERDRASGSIFYRFVDARLEAHGYHPNVAASIVRRLERKGLVDCGVSERSGWLTPEGHDALSQSLAAWLEGGSRV